MLTNGLGIGTEARRDGFSLSCNMEDCSSLCDPPHSMADLWTSFIVAGLGTHLTKQKPNSEVPENRTGSLRIASSSRICPIKSKRCWWHLLMEKRQKRRLCHCLWQVPSPSPAPPYCHFMENTCLLPGMIPKHTIGTKCVLYSGQGRVGQSITGTRVPTSHGCEGGRTYGLLVFLCCLRMQSVTVGKAWWPNHSREAES